MTQDFQQLCLAAARLDSEIDRFLGSDQQVTPADALKLIEPLDQALASAGYLARRAAKVEGAQS